MAACGLIMGGSALAYTVATLIRSGDHNDEGGYDFDDSGDDGNDNCCGSDLDR